MFVCSVDNRNSTADQRQLAGWWGETFVSHGGFWLWPGCVRGAQGVHMCEGCVVVADGRACAAAVCGEQVGAEELMAGPVLLLCVGSRWVLRS